MTEWRRVKRVRTAWDGSGALGGAGAPELPVIVPARPPGCRSGVMIALWTVRRWRVIVGLLSAGGRVCRPTSPRGGVPPPRRPVTALGTRGAPSHHG